MKIVDRYILRQLAGPFIFFLFVFGGILWLNQALRIVDIVVDNGQPGMVFIELSSYLIPRVFDGVFPVAAFAAALFLTNRLYTESEYAVLMAAGQTPLSFARPFIVFGIICFTLVSLLTHIITPLSNNAFKQRQHEIRQEYLSQLIKVGEFVTPQKGVTFYFGGLQEDGLLEDVLIREITEQGKQVIHTAPTGRLIDDPGDAKLILLDGTLQQLDQESRLLNVIQFDSLAYNLSKFSKNIGPRTIGATSTVTSHLPWSIAKADSVNKPSAIVAQSRLVESLFSLLMPLMGAAILFSGSFSRSGFYYRIIFAIAMLLLLNTLRGATQSYVSQTPSLSFLLYAPVALAFAVNLVLLFITIKGINSHTILNSLFKSRRSI